MNSMETCNSVTFYFKKNSFSDVHIRKWVFHEIKRDGITSLHGIHVAVAGRMRKGGRASWFILSLDCIPQKTLLDAGSQCCTRPTEWPGGKKVYYRIEQAAIVKGQLVLQFCWRDYCLEGVNNKGLLRWRSYMPWCNSLSNFLCLFQGQHRQP